MQSDTFVEGAASVAAVAAAAALLYSRASAHAARDAVAAAERTVKLAEGSRQAAERARLRRRLERVGALVQHIASSVTDTETGTDTDELAQKTQAQCRALSRALSRALVGLIDFLPKCTELSRAGTAEELAEKARTAGLEVDAALRKLDLYRRRSTYRPRHQAPWHRPARVRSAAVTGGASRDRVTRPPSP